MESQNKIVTTTKLTGDIIEKDDLPPPPVRKAAPQGFPSVKKIKKKIPIKKPEPQKPPEPDVDPEIAMEEEESNEMKPMDQNANRYDFNGEILNGVKESEETHLKGLHNHNDHADKPGYAMYELSMMCRSRNTAQRAFALGAIANIIAKNPEKSEQEVRMFQVPQLAIMAFTPPTNLSVKTAAMNIIHSLLVHKFKNVFSIYPYPAVPPDTSMSLEFATHADDIVEAAVNNEQLMNYLALFTASKHFAIEKLSKLPPSQPLFRLARSVWINWGEIFAQKQALSALTSDIEVAKEAAAVLMLQKYVPKDDILDQLHPNVLAVLLSNTNDVEKYEKYIQKILDCCPDAFAMEFAANCADKKLISREKAEEICDKSSFSISYVSLLEYAGHKITHPELPKSETECWEKRDTVCGMVEYILRTKDYRYLPDLFPCLYSFTNPAAEMLIKTIFGFSPTKERPIDPLSVFDILATCKQEEVKPLLDIAKYFPLRYGVRVFSRDDCHQLDRTIYEFLMDIEDPLPPHSLRSFDLSDYFERFMFDCFELRSFQMMAYFCIAQGADDEVRQHFWTDCYGYLSRISLTCDRTDVHTFKETSMETMSVLINAIKKSKFCETPILNISIKYVTDFLNDHKGEIVGSVMLEKVQQLPTDWSKKILSAVIK